MLTSVDDELILIGLSKGGSLFMTVTLEVKERAVRPRSLKKELREGGQIPAVIHGNKLPSTAISVNEKALQKILRDNGKNTVISMTINGKKVNSLLAEQQVDTFTKKWQHVEFIAVNMNEATEVNAEIVLINEAKGVKEGGVLVQHLYEVTVSATPDKLPENIEVDVADLGIGDSLSLADIIAGKEYSIIGNLEDQIVGVTEQVAEEIPEETTDTAEVQPKVIGEEE